MAEKIVYALAAGEKITSIQDYNSDGATTLKVEVGNTYTGDVTTISHFTLSKESYEACKDTITKIHVVDVKTTYHTGITIEAGAFSVFPNLAEFIYESGATETTTIKGKIFSTSLPLTTVKLKTMPINKLPDGLFEGISTLLDITLPETLTHVTEKLLKGTSIKKIVIPKNVTYLYAEAFTNTPLEEVEFESSVLSFNRADDPFAGMRRTVKQVTIRNLKVIPAGLCSNMSIDSFTIPSCTTDIGHHAFEGCNYLKSIDLQNVSVIEQSAFEFCFSLETVVGLEKVTTIGDRAFSYTFIQSPTLNLKSIKSIGRESFFMCPLKKVVFGSGLTTIGLSAFLLSSIEEADFSACSGLLSIPFGAFEKCVELTTVSLPSSVRHIGTRAFYDCKKLDMLTWDFSTIHEIGIQAFTGTASYLNSSNWNSDVFSILDCVLDSHLQGTVSTLPTSIMPATSRVIADGVFANYFPVTSIQIPKTIKSIGNSAYYNNNAVVTLSYGGTTSEWESIRLGNNWNYNINVPVITCSNGSVIVQLPEEYHFWYSTTDGKQCTLNNSAYTLTWNAASNLGDVHTPISAGPSVPYGTTTSLLSSNVKTVYIATLYTSIGLYTFINNSNLESINLNKVLNIGRNAFQGCSKLKAANLLQCGDIGEEAFKGCSSLNQLNIRAHAIIRTDAFSGCTGLSEIGLVYLDKYGYSYNSKVFPANEILYNNGCTLDRIVLNPSGNEITSLVFTEHSKGTGIVDHAFAFCKNIKSVYIGRDMGTVGAGVFVGCSSLEEIIVEAPNAYGLSSVGDQLLVDSSSGEDIVIAGCVKSGGLGSISIALKKVATEAFMGNKNLKSLYVSAYEVGSKAFLNCSNLESISFTSTSVDILENAFDGCTSLDTMSFTGVGFIGDKAFNGCSKLTELNMKVDSYKETDGVIVQGIHPGAFIGCTGITKIHWDAVHYSVDGPSDPSNSSFYNIRKLITEFTFGSRSGARSILRYLCYGMDKLTSINVSSYCWNIGKGAFQECTGLTSVSLPSGLKSIEADAFKDCTSLTSLSFKGTQSDWSYVTLGTGWNEGSAIKTITCSDGDISLTL